MAALLALFFRLLAAQAFGDADEFSELGNQAVGVAGAGDGGHFFDGAPVKFAVVFAAAQLLGVGSGGQGQAGVGVGLGERDAAGGNGLFDQFACALAGQFVAHFDVGLFVFAAVCGGGFLVAGAVQPAGFALRDDFIQSGYAVAGADVAGIDFVVVEVFVA